MTFPGFSAEASLNAKQANYQTTDRSTGSGIAPAFGHPDPCLRKRGCARARCECSRAGGLAVFDPEAPCRFSCEFDS